jgi:SAM-dependent methyltransferase
VGLIGRQFGSPSGVLGRLAVRFMVGNNGGFNRQLVKAVAGAGPPPRVVAELGFGPGVGLAALLDAFPTAKVLGADPSPAAAREAAARNKLAVTAGRLQLFTGDAAALRRAAPVDLVVCVHVLYFWHDPATALRQIRDLLSDDGRLVLGYQLRHHMPAVAQRDFPREGHRLYASDNAVREVLLDADLRPRDLTVLGSPDAPLGRVLVATRG